MPFDIGTGKPVASEQRLVVRTIQKKQPRMLMACSDEEHRLIAIPCRSFRIEVTFNLIPFSRHSRNICSRDPSDSSDRGLKNWINIGLKVARRCYFWYLHTIARGLLTERTI